MNTRAVQVRKISFESFCTSLDQMSSDICAINASGKRVIESIPIETRVGQLFNVVSSCKPLPLRRFAIRHLTELFANWPPTPYSSVGIPPKVAHDSISYVGHLIICEDTNPLIDDICSMCVILILGINKHKIKKWKVVYELVSICLRANQQNTTLLMHTLVVQYSEIFGKNKKSIRPQYKNFLMECLDQVSNQPEMAVFAIQNMEHLLDNREYKFCRQTVSKLIRNLIDALEEIVTTDHAIEYIYLLYNMLENYDIIFMKHTKRIASIIMNILQNRNIEIAVEVGIVKWITTFIKKFPIEIENWCFEVVTVVIDNILELQVDTHLDDVDEWFRDFWTKYEVVSSSYAINTRGSLLMIAGVIDSQLIYPMLVERMSKLLESRDWRYTVTAIDLMGIIIAVCGPTEIPNPWEFFTIMKPFFSHSNPVIVCSALQTVALLCSTFRTSPYRELHGLIVSLIVESADIHSSLYVKVKTVDTLGNICRQSLIDDFDLDPRSAARLFFKLFYIFHQRKDAEFLKSSVKLLTRNVKGLYKLLGERIDPFVPDIVDNLLRVLDRIFRLPDYDRAYHRVLDCLKAVISHCPRDGPEIICQPIVTYVKNFCKSYNPLNDTIEVTPCFFPLLIRLAGYKSKSFYSIIPALGFSIYKFLCKVKKLPMGTDDIFDLELNRDSPPLICSSCYPENCDIEDSSDNGINRLCTMASSFFIQYCEELFQNIELYLAFFNQLLKNNENKTFCGGIALTIPKLLECCFRLGNNVWAKSFWESHLKKSLLRTLSESPIYEAHKVVQAFKECIIIPGFHDALNSSDIEKLGHTYSDLTELALGIINNRRPQPFDFPNNDVRLIFRVTDPRYPDLILSSLRECIYCTVPIYGVEMINTCLPMLKDLMSYPITKKNKIVPKYAILLLGYVLKFENCKGIDLWRLAPRASYYCIEILITSYDMVLLKNTTIVTKKLKNMYPIPFERQLSMFYPSHRSYLELILSNR